MNIIKNNNAKQELEHPKPKSLLVTTSKLPVKSLFQILLKNPTLVNTIDNNRETILTYAIKQEKIDICQLILTSNIIDLSYQDKNGNSYLHLAVMGQLEGVVKSLIEKGIYINIQNNDGNTPLHIAYLKNNIPIINILINNGIDIKIRNNDNKLAEELINCNNNKENNDYSESKGNENSSNKKNKDIKLKQKNGSNKKISPNALNSEFNIVHKKNKTYNESFIGNSHISIQNILGKNKDKKKSSFIQPSLKSRKDKLTEINSPIKIGSKSNKKEKVIKKDIKNSTYDSSPKSNNKTERNQKRKMRQIIHKINNKPLFEDKIISNNKNVEIGNNTSGETKYKSGTYRDRIINEELGQDMEVQKLNNNYINKEDEIFNIVESLDYKQKLAHTSEINTQVVKYPKKYQDYKVKEFKEDNIINTNGNNLNENNEKNTIENINIDRNENRYDFKDKEEKEEDNSDEDNIYSNENIFCDNKYVDVQNGRGIDNENLEITEEVYNELNKSTLNYYENSVLSSCYQSISPNNEKDKNVKYNSQNTKTFSNKFHINSKNNNVFKLYKYQNIDKSPFNYKKYSNNDLILKNNDYNKLISNKYFVTGKSKQSESINPLKEFLSQINMFRYIDNCIENGFDDINLIIDQAKKGIYITDSELKEAGIMIPGDRAKILIRIQEKAGNFGFTIPKSVYYSCNDLNEIENDVNINKLKNWLQNLKIENYLMNFVLNGYHSIELLLLQIESKNPITPEFLKDELGIEKVGHRSRIINKLKEESKSYNNNLKTSALIVGDDENNKYCDCLII